MAPMRTERSLAGRRTIGASQQRVDASDELARAERLRHVVVGADGETDEQVGLAVARGQHQYRQRMLTLDLLADLDAVETGEHQVEHDEIGAEPLAQLDAAGAVAGDLDFVALAAQPGGDRGRDRRFVLDHRDPAAGRGAPRRVRPGGRRSTGHR